MYSQYQQYNQRNQQTTSHPTQTVIPPNPVETYTKYYHEWTKLSKCKNEIENNRQWAKYYAEESSRAAHHFYQNPEAKTAPFPLPPQPPAIINDVVPVPVPVVDNSKISNSCNSNSIRSSQTAAVTSSNTSGKPSSSGSAGSVTRYVKRNMERLEVKNDKALRKLVQAEIEKQIAAAIQEGSLQSKNWDELPLIDLASYGTATVTVTDIAIGTGTGTGTYTVSKQQQQEEHCYGNKSSSGSTNDHYRKSNNPWNKNAGKIAKYHSKLSSKDNKNNYYGPISSVSTNGIDNFDDNSYYGPSSRVSNDPLEGVNNPKPSSLFSSSFSSFSSQYSNDIKNAKNKNNKRRNYHQQQRQEEEDFMALPTMKKKLKITTKPQTFHRGGLNVSQQALDKRASRFSNLGGTHKTKDKYVLGGNDKYMGKRLIGGNDTKLDTVDYEKMTVKGTSSTLEKDYLRLTAPPLPELVRPIGILQQHLRNLQLDYYGLKDKSNQSCVERDKNDSVACTILQERMRTPQEKWNIIDCDHNGDSHVSCQEDHPRRDYLWFCSQLKAIRQDCTVQRIQGDFGVEVYETHARIALQEGDLNEYNQCQTQLKELYKMVPSTGSSKSVKIADESYSVTSVAYESCSSPVWKNQGEFIAYRLLYYVYLSTNEKYSGGSSDMFHIMRSLTSREKNHPAIQHALRVREAIAFSNYYLFFRLHKKSPNLGFFFTTLLVPYVRFRSLKRIAKAYRPSIELMFCLEQLGFLNDGDVNEDISTVIDVGKSWLISCGCIFDQYNDQIITKDSEIQVPNTEKNSLI